MDVIDRAIANQTYIVNDANLQHQTWHDFENCLQGKQLFFYGVGVSIRIFYEKYGSTKKVCGVIDNDPVKKGFCLSEFIYTDDTGVDANMIITGEEILRDRDRDNTLVLIASTNYYVEIAIRLSNMGYKNIYSILLMETAERLQKKKVTYDVISDTQLWVEKCSRYPIDPKKIFFHAIGIYADHGKYITEQLLKLRNDLDIVWALNSLKTEVPRGVRKISLDNWGKYLYEIETASVWITNTVFPDYLIKRKSQIYIETKHWASVTLKRFYLDAATLNTKDNKENVAWWKRSSKMMDYIITGSDFDTASCRRGFAFDREVVQIGSPRSDAMFRQNEMKEKVYNYYQMDLDRKLLVYAPTYRYKKDEKKRVAEIREVDIDYDLVQRTLENRFGGKWYIMLRLHPGHETEADNLQRPSYVIDASRYEDGEELAAACDVMISDYSSIMFEPAFVRKPVFLFASDRDDYIDREYDLLIDYDTLPFPIAVTNEGLADAIKHFDKEKYESDVERFMQKYGVCEDGHASLRAAQFISDLIPI